MAKKAGKKDPVANMGGVTKERTKYWADMLKTYTGKEYVYRDEDGNEKKVKIEAGKRDLETVAKQLGNREAIHMFYDNKTRQILTDTKDSSSKLEKETEEGLQKYIDSVAKELEHTDLIDKSPQEFYGMMMQIGASLEIPEQDMKELLNKAKKNTGKGREARASLIGYISQIARASKIQNSDRYHTRHINANDLKQVTAYKHAVAIGANRVSHGQYSPNIDNIVTFDSARNLLGQHTAEPYLRPEKAPHSQNPTEATYHTPHKEKGKKKATK